MANYSTLSKQELASLQKELEEKYNSFKARNLSLNMARGKPGADQLDLSMELLNSVNDKTGYKAEDGTDCRNYGILDGIPECKKLFAEILGVDEKNVIIGGNSSLNLMFDYIAQCMTNGCGDTPWAKLDKIKFLCPAPGYDRHFGILDYFGIEMLTVPMLDNGPDLKVVDELIKDSSVKGMFCVPKYSNPEGKTYSDEVVEHLASMKPAAKDFRIIWDNAYCVHHINDNHDKLLNIFDVCEKYGTQDRIFEVVSTSKITFPGAGVSALAASDNNIQMIKKRMNMQTIGADKLNQLRHAKYLKDANGVDEYMKKHAEILAPKFKAVLDAFDKEFSDLGIAKWTKPNGGYFISLDVMDGCAKEVVRLCKEAGVALTPAGATFPYGKDPHDKNIRIAPSFPPVAELELAVELLCICVKLASVNKLLEA
ncbi:MAG: aminotransferase class I/II-fold pyridoxal phosphate-dependent enzyme [Clostridiales bacterium]|nr:aminotransferase class I/II-fold pyridoxal phosphate-dependent enzyme [Clostridiales bacterium]